MSMTTISGAGEKLPLLVAVPLRVMCVRLACLRSGVLANCDSTGLSVSHLFLR